MGPGGMSRRRMIDLVYPVGSIYMSTNNVGPQELFGGTWEQIEDRFLLAAGSTYSAGSTGGEASHKLTVDELPNYNLSQGGSYRKGACLAQTYNGIQLSESTNDGAIPSLGVNSKGKDKAHNNMPPYLTVYVWKRTA